MTRFYRCVANALMHLESNYIRQDSTGKVINHSKILSNLKVINHPKIFRKSDVLATHR